MVEAYDGGKQFILWSERQERPGFLGLGLLHILQEYASKNLTVSHQTLARVSAPFLLVPFCFIGNLWSFGKTQDINNDYAHVSVETDKS